MTPSPPRRRPPAPTTSAAAVPSSDQHQGQARRLGHDRAPRYARTLSSARPRWTRRSCARSTTCRRCSSVRRRSRPIRIPAAPSATGATVPPAPEAVVCASALADKRGGLPLVHADARGQARRADRGAGHHQVRARWPELGRRRDRQPDPRHDRRRGLPLRRPGSSATSSLTARLPPRRPRLDLGMQREDPVGGHSGTVDLGEPTRPSGRRRQRTTAPPGSRATSAPTPADDRTGRADHRRAELSREWTLRSCSACSGTPTNGVPEDSAAWTLPCPPVTTAAATRGSTRWLGRTPSTTTRPGASDSRSTRSWTVPATRIRPVPGRHEVGNDGADEVRRGRGHRDVDRGAGSAQQGLRPRRHRHVEVGVDGSRVRQPGRRSVGRPRGGSPRLHLLGAHPDDVGQVGDERQVAEEQRGQARNRLDPDRAATRLNPAV